MDLDVAIIGDSLAGLVCAVRLRELGHRVGFGIDPHDSCSAEGIWELPPTLANDAPERGELVIERLRDRLDQLGYELLWDAGFVSCSGERVLIQDVWQEVELARPRLVIATPNGTETRPPEFDGSATQLLSTDAWTDAPYCADVPVVVIGSGERAASEALIAASKRARVTLLCEAPALHAPSLIDEVRACPLISLIEGAAVQGPLTRGGDPIGVLALREGEPIEIPARLVFAARKVAWNWQLFGSEEAARVGIDAGLVYLTGLAAELPDWDFAAHLRHAEQTVERVHERLG